MRHFIFVLLLITMQATAGGYSANERQIQQQLKATPEMSDRCQQNIDYYKAKIFKYELRLQLTEYQKLKVHYYESELQSWENYCNGYGEDPDFR